MLASPNRHWKGWSWFDLLLMLGSDNRSTRAGAQWIIDDLEFGKRVAFEWVEQDRIPLDQRVAYQLRCWEVDRWLQSPEGEASLAAARRELEKSTAPDGFES